MRKSQGTFKVPKRRSLREEVYETLKRAILIGRIKGGERLIEEQMASLIGTSRTPVREAIHKLEKDELVFRLPRGGFAVRQFGPEDVEEVFGIRSVLESHAAVLATRSITPERMRRLEKKIEESEQCLASGNTEHLIRLNTEFHDILYKAAGSKKLYNLIGSFRDYFYRYRAVSLGVDGSPRISIRDHKDMLDAMKAKEEAKVERLVKKHILRGKDIVVQQIRRGIL